MSMDLWMQKIAEVSPEAHDFMMTAAPEIGESPFRDEIVDEVRGIFKKVAMDWAGVGDTAAKAGIGVGVAAGAGIAMSLAGDAMDALKRGITKGKHYRSMLRENQDLQEHPMGAKATQAMFSTLHKFNPEFAADPYVAGTFVRNQLDAAGADKKQVDLSTLTGLISARKNLSDIRSKRIPQMNNFLPGVEDKLRYGKPQ
jgi:hypothetical protein